MHVFPVLREKSVPLGEAIQTQMRRDQRLYAQTTPTSNGLRPKSELDVGLYVNRETSKSRPRLGREVELSRT